MNWSSKLSIALVLGSALFLFFSISPQSFADPVGPVVTGGANPWLSFTGTVQQFQTETVYTVPGNQILVVTSICARDFTSNSIDDELEVLQGSVVKYANIALECSAGDLFGEGRARLVFEPGTDLNLEYTTSGPDITYYIEGFLAAP